MAAATIVGSFPDYFLPARALFTVLGLACLAFAGVLVRRGWRQDGLLLAAGICMVLAAAVCVVGAFMYTLY